jgi:DNA primase
VGVAILSSASSFDNKERVKQAIDIVDLVGGYISLRRQGRNFVGLCPWHDDRRPSLQISPDRQTFKCWVCNIGGDVFSFLMQREGVTFPEALAMLAERAGIVLEPRSGSRIEDRGSREDAGPYDPQSSILNPQSSQATPDKPTLYKAMAWAVEQFHQCLLNDPQAEVARAYLAERGISDDSIHKFQLGFSPDSWDWLTAQVRHKPSAIAALQRVGVLGKSERGTHFDRFKGRVLFPIRNTQGKPIALGGRILPGLVNQSADADRPPAKYINSPETPLFSKNREFYALDLAREAIGRMQRILIMEGYTDVILAHQYGFANAVAVLGTALGENHVRRLRFADNCRITLVLDGDEAGRRRAGEVLNLFVAAQVDLHVLTLPDNLDPCDFLCRHGSQAFEALLDRSVDALEHKIRTVAAGVDLTDTHHAHQALEDVLETLAAAPSGAGDSNLRQHQILTRLAKTFHIAEEELRSRLATLRRRAHKPRRDHDEKQPLAQTERIESWERVLLELLLLEPEAVPEVAQSIPHSQFATEPARRIFAACCDLSRRGIHPDFDHLMLQFDDPRVQSLLIELDQHGRDQNIPDVPVRIRQSLDNFRWRQEQRRRHENRSALEDRRLDEQEEIRLLHDLLTRERTRQGISGPMDG